jgi:hypothetical protein
MTMVHVWKRVTRPKQLGGLGIMDLECFNMTLRLRWPWLQDGQWEAMAGGCNQHQQSLK